MTVLRTVLFLFNVFAVLFCATIASADQHRTLACIGGTVYASPTAEPVRHALLLVLDGVIQTVVDASAIKYTLPPDTQTINCTGKFIVAGFWNSHVHFGRGWTDPGGTPAYKLESHMRDMLTRWGFTTVWDLGSLSSKTLEIRHRVEIGEVLGPRILMAGEIFPEHGHPVYIPAWTTH